MPRWNIYQLQKMDKRELDNWKKVKKALEEADKTDCEYYRRAVLIVEGKPDPLE